MEKCLNFEASRCGRVDFLKDINIERKVRMTIPPEVENFSTVCEISASL
jgi:hypothetical protein